MMVSSNNVGQTCGITLTSYDPNVKEVSPSGNIAQSQDWLTYTILFQNTGNFTAQNIFIRDTLDNDFDVSSFAQMEFL